MNKAFVKESDRDDDEDVPQAQALPAGTRNYMTPEGYARLRDELAHLMNVERPGVVQVVSWAASNGDRSENGDYLYGKKRLREIDRRMRFLTKRLDIAEVVDASQQPNRDQVFFGATVVYADKAGEEHTVTIVGVDEAEPLAGKISWISPVARALIKAREGDTVVLRTPGGVEELDILEVR
ncbi:transcription elongation factor GreB, partial [Bordetella hinzii]